MKIAHLFTGGNIGGIECMCREYTKISIHEHYILVLWGDGPVLKEIRENGIKVVYLNLKHTDLISGYLKIKKFCSDNKIDVLIAEHEAILSHVFLWMFKKNNLKKVVYAHCNASFMCRSQEKKGLFIRKLILSLSMKSADLVVAISNNVKLSLIQQFSVPDRKITVLYNGVALPNNLLSSRKKDLHKIIYVGRLIEDKGVQKIIDAVKMLGPLYHLDIIGDGPYRSTLENQCKDCEIMFSFHGFQSDVYSYLSNTSVFVHVPDCEEGFGLTVVEAMASGNICIVAEKGALPEIIQDNYNGFVLKQSDSKSIAQKIDFIANSSSDEFLDKIRNNGINTAHNLSINKYADNLDKLLSCL